MMTKIKMKIPKEVTLLVLVIAIFALLYSFICALSILTISLQLLSSRMSVSLLAYTNLQNPILGLMMGVVATAIIQSSSATTSIVVALVASGSISLREGIPVIMGTNVGTSLTSTMVALSSIKNTEEYKLAFSAAVVHDIFNWLTIFFMLPLEIGTSFLEKMSGILVMWTTKHNVSLSSDFTTDALFKPIISNIIVLKDQSVLNSVRVKDAISENEDEASNEEVSEEYDLKHSSSEELGSEESIEDTSSSVFSMLEDDCKGGCTYLFANTYLSDESVGAILLVVSFIIAILCYIFLVKIMKRFLSLPLAGLSAKFFSKDLPLLPYLSGYIFILVGAAVTAVVQSSSILTSALVPLVSTNIISLERAYPLTLGANLGTTTTSILTALLSRRENALRLALCHFLFNVFGIVAFFPITPFRWPLFIAKAFGMKVIKYKWFSIFYLAMSFFILPLLILGLSSLNTYFMYTTVVTAFVWFLLVIIINYLQDHKPGWLPNVLKNWQFLPKELRSFSTIDYVVQTYMEVYCCCIVNRTVAAVPIIGGYRAQWDKGVFGLELAGSKEMQMVKIENAESAE